MTFALDGDELVTVVDHKPKSTARLQRLVNIERDARVTVLVDHYADDWEALWWVRLRGRARILEGGPAHAAAIDRLVAEYEPYRRHRPDGPVIAVAVERWRWWSGAAM
ncbi:MAG: TIGR03668 family PPOX class F420-dependent oxidoreductase [Acidimicrobiia bacterium]|nr:TIGR03668 family PPOX class F420-dependent oxidoreductase [Acidimicrobiia bacterium]